MKDDFAALEDLVDWLQGCDWGSGPSPSSMLEAITRAYQLGLERYNGRKRERITGSPNQARPIPGELGTSTPSHK
jgi:hypothetical protein